MSSENVFVNVLKLLHIDFRDAVAKASHQSGKPIKEASPCCASLALKHYLLKPVQRIPQYQLLLTGYLKNLSPDSADYKDTQGKAKQLVSWSRTSLY
uniref:DH domain-containing protein n=1 Tax=Hucho hucho TaxID=62062 RepID=A0A4W5PF49_9TELE